MSVKGFRGRLFIRRGSRDCQGVDVGLHEISEGGIDRAMALHGRLPGEMRRDDSHPEVPAAGAGAGVAGVQMAFVGDLQCGWRQCALQLRADCFDALGGIHCGSTFLNGRTRTAAYTPAAR